MEKVESGYFEDTVLNVVASWWCHRLHHKDPVHTEVTWKKQQRKHHNLIHWSAVALA